MASNPRQRTMGGGTGRFSSRVFMRMFLPWDDLQCHPNLVPAKRERSVYMINIVPLFPGCITRLALPGLDGERPGKHSFYINGTWKLWWEFFWDVHAWRDPVPSRPVTSRPIPSRPVSLRHVTSRPIPSRPVTSRPVSHKQPIISNGLI